MYLKVPKYFKYLKNLAIVAGSALIFSGYGYTGDLPELGGQTKPVKPSQNRELQEGEVKKEFRMKHPVFPRVYSSYKLTKYSKYLDDLNHFSYLLEEIKDVLESDRRDKMQLFCAKVNLLNLYMKVLKNKYNERPERFYETYKQLVNLDNYLTEIAGYLRETEKVRATSRGSLKDKLQDEKIIRQKINMAMIPLNTVIEIISDAEQ